MIKSAIKDAALRKWKIILLFLASRLLVLQRKVERSLILGELLIELCLPAQVEVLTTNGLCNRCQQKALLYLRQTIVHLGQGKGVSS